MGFALVRQTMLAWLLPCLAFVHASPGGHVLAPETYKTHTCRRGGADMRLLLSHVKENVIPL